MRSTRDLLRQDYSGMRKVREYFGRAHSHDWDLERDIPWKHKLKPEECPVSLRWAPYSHTSTFQRLPRRTQVHFTRRALGLVLQSLTLGEAVALEVCLKQGTRTPFLDHRAHVAAQAKDEARHHEAYRRLLELMGDEPDELDPGTRATFDAVLALDDMTDLVAWEQFYLESVAVNVLRRVASHAMHPLVKKMFALNLRDEARHMGFGVAYVSDWMQQAAPEDQISFAKRWLEQILPLDFGPQDPLPIRRITRWLFEAGEADSLRLAQAMASEQYELTESVHAAMAKGRHIPQELKSARQAGLLAPHIVEALGLAKHPLVRGALKAPPA